MFVVGKRDGNVGQQRYLSPTRQLIVKKNWKTSATYFKHKFQDNTKTITMNHT